MYIIFDKHGYPSKINLSTEIKSITESDITVNWYSLEDFYKKIKSVIEYWQELHPTHENMQYGEMKKEEYDKLVIQAQTKHFGDKLSDVKIFEVYYGS